VELREYRDCDLDGLLSVWANASKVGHPFLTDDFLDLERKNIPEVYLPSGEAKVALIEEVVVGFTILHGNEVGALFVDPKFHGKGIGQLLIGNALKIYDDLEVEVFKQNTIGRRFYSKYGFNLLSEYHHDESGFDMLRLQFTQNS
jgi:putative acetyltransferase